MCFCLLIQTLGIFSLLDPSSPLDLYSTRHFLSGSSLIHTDSLNGICPRYTTIGVPRMLSDIDI
nr:MAG TPA: hypothetical protein [Caudoviricetes sp.]